MSARPRALAKETERIVASGGWTVRPGKRRRARAGCARARLTTTRYLTTAAAAASLAAFASFAAAPDFAGTGVACGAQVTSLASTVPLSR